MASLLCRRIYHSLLCKNPISNRHQSLLVSVHRFSTESPADSASGTDSDSDSTIPLETESDPVPHSTLPSEPESDTVPHSTLPSEPESEPLLPQSSNSNSGQRNFANRPLENGLDTGIYRAILIGVVGQHAVEKKIRSGRGVTLLTIGTGGMRNNRRPLQNEDPRDFANRSMVQWHRVSIYAERLGALVLKNALPGSILYLEGNLETKVFNDSLTGLTRRVREVAIRGDGRIVFLDKGNVGPESQHVGLKGVGYY